MTCDDTDRLYRLAVAVLSVVDHPINSCTIKSAMVAIRREENAIANHECCREPRWLIFDESSEVSENNWDFSNS